MSEVENNQILITRNDTNNYSVEWGDVKTDRLTWDEMLGQIACLTLKGESYFPVNRNFPQR